MGTLTFVSNTGTPLDLPRSASTTQDWTYWNDTTQTAFVEYTQDVGDDWHAKASYNYRSSESPSELFMGYSPTASTPPPAPASTAGPSRARRAARRTCSTCR